MKDQFVIAYLADLSMTQEVVSHALYLSQMLNKGLILLYVQDDHLTPTTIEHVTPQILQLEQTHASARPAHAALKGHTKEIINALPTLLNGVVAVAGVNPNAKRHSPTHPAQVLKLFNQCKIAYLTVQRPLQQATPYRQVAYSVDFRKESKDKLIWASYFARFNKSQLQMLHHSYTDSGLQQKWNNNILFMNKFFKGLGITYRSVVVSGRALFPEVQVCHTAALQDFDLLISVTTDTRDLDIIEWFAGVAEQRTVANKYQLPVLYINPRNDIYVLCD